MYYGKVWLHYYLYSNGMCTFRFALYNATQQDCCLRHKSSHLSFPFYIGFKHYMCNKTSCHFVIDRSVTAEALSVIEDLTYHPNLMV